VALNIAESFPTVAEYDEALFWQFTEPVENNEVLTAEKLTAS
jgi:hypothetical protein